MIKIITGALLLLLAIDNSRAGSTPSKNLELDQSENVAENPSRLDRHELLGQFQTRASNIEAQFASKWALLPENLQLGIMIFDEAVTDAKAKAEALELEPPTDKQLLVAGSVKLIEQLDQQMDRKRYRSNLEWQRAAIDAANGLLVDFFAYYEVNFSGLLKEYEDLVSGPNGSRAQFLLKRQTRSIIQNAKLCPLDSVLPMNEIIEQYSSEHPYLTSIDRLHSRLFSNDQLLPMDEVERILDDYIEQIGDIEALGRKTEELKAISKARQISEEGCDSARMMKRMQMITYYKRFPNIGELLKFNYEKQRDFCEKQKNQHAKKTEPSAPPISTLLEQIRLQPSPNYEVESKNTESSCSSSTSSESKLKMPLDINLMSSLIGKCKVDAETDRKLKLGRVQFLERSLVDSMVYLSGSFKRRLEQLNYLVYRNQSPISPLSERQLYEGIANYISFSRHDFLWDEYKLFSRFKAELELLFNSPPLPILRRSAQPYIERLFQQIEEDGVDASQALNKSTLDWLGIINILDRVAEMKESDQKRLFNQFVARTEKEFWIENLESGASTSGVEPSSLINAPSASSSGHKKTRKRRKDKAKAASVNFQHLKP